MNVNAAICLGFKVVVEADSFSPGYEMQPTALLSAIQHSIAAQEPGALVAPYLFPSEGALFCDRGDEHNKFFEPALETV